MIQNRRPKSVSVIIATYNKPDYLAVILHQLAKQTRIPDEIVIADDGSSDVTCTTIDRIIQNYPNLKIIHSWHPDTGFDKCGALNKAIMQASSEYVLFLDDDCACPPHFIHEHIGRAKSYCFTVGSSAHVNRETTEQILQQGDIDWFLELPLVEKIRRRDRSKHKGISKFAHRAALTGNKLGRLFDRLYFAQGVLRGGNAGIWKGDLLNVNGFDADLKYGHEDKDLGIRLSNAGVTLLQVRFSAANFHLYHDRPYADPEIRRRQSAHCRDVRRKGVTRCKNGIRDLRKGAD